MKKEIYGSEKCESDAGSSHFSDRKSFCKEDSKKVKVW